VVEPLHMPSLGGATEWLNSEPLGPAEVRGHVVLVDFWTLTCINWLRTEPYIRAWSQAYRNDRLVGIGVHTPEFSSEHQIGRVRQATKERGIDYPSRSTTTMQFGAPSTTTTGRRCTSSTRTASSATTTSAKDATSNPSAPSSGCSIEGELVCVEGLGVLIGVLGFPP
jgi:thiol-disulfide isomerase/thioredoxin